MKKINFKKISLCFFMLCTFSTANAQDIFINEDPTYIRFEQYTGEQGTISFWRLPNPGVSVFGNSNCKLLTIPAVKPEQSSRFLALYLFAKSSEKKIFYFFSPLTCIINSFGMDG